MGVIRRVEHDLNDSKSGLQPYNDPTEMPANFPSLKYREQAHFLLFSASRVGFTVKNMTTGFLSLFLLSLERIKDSTRPAEPAGFKEK